MPKQSGPTIEVVADGHTDQEDKAGIPATQTCGYGSAGPSDETVFGMVQPVMRDLGDVRATEPKVLEENLTLLPGDMRLAGFEPLLSDSWPRGADGNETALRQLTAPWRGIRSAVEAVGAEIILLDLGSNLGSLTRSYIVVADHILVPAAPDLFWLQGLRNLGPVLREWRAQWPARRDEAAKLDIDAPESTMNPLCYVLSQHGVYGNRPVAARWVRTGFAWTERVLTRDSCQVCNIT